MGDNILIVDDQPGILLLLEEILKNEGYDITTATSGQAAIEALRNRTYQLMILDYRLPIMNGIEVTEQLEKENISVPIIIMSGLPEKVSQIIQEKKQIIALLAKPFDITEVTELVKKSLT